MTDAIDAAWEEQILPTLCEYTRIPCLSPAYDPDWSETRRHRRRRRAPARLGARPGRCAGGRDHRAAGPHSRAARRQRWDGRSDHRLRPHGQAAAARRVAPRARALRAGARGRPPLRPRDSGRRLRDVRRRDGSAGSGRRPRPRPHPHRGQRGERQPRPPGPPRQPQGAHRDAAPRDLPRLGRAQQRPAVADDLTPGDPHRHRAGRRVDGGHPQRTGRRHRPLLVPHPAAHPVADRGRGDRPHPPARAPAGRGSPSHTGPTSRRWRSSSPRARRRSSPACVSSPPTRSSA